MLNCILFVQEYFKFLTTNELSKDFSLAQESGYLSRNLSQEAQFFKASTPPRKETVSLLKNIVQFFTLQS